MKEWMNEWMNEWTKQANKRNNFRLLQTQQMSHIMYILCKWATMVFHVEGILEFQTICNQTIATDDVA